MTRAEPPDFGTTFKGSEVHIPPAHEEGDNSCVVGQQHEPRDRGLAANNPLGDKARKLDTACPNRADPGRAARSKRILPLPRVQRGPAGPGMARTTIPSAVRAYLDAMRPYLSDATLVRKARNLRTIARDLKASMAPSQIGEREVEALLLAWRSRGLDSATQAKYLIDFDGFLAWNGNATITNLRKNKHVRLPKPVSKPIRILDAAEIERLRVAADSIEGWPGDVARFLVAFLPATGLRRKEVRLARLKDLDLEKGRILVAHPKGEGSWAAPDYGPVPVFVRPVIEDFLMARRTYLDGADSEWLVPYRRVSDETGPWSDPLLGWLKSELARLSGVAFSLKTFRATFAQIAKDRGAPIEAVSRALRHASTHTTEAYYARIRADDAFREIERAFAQPVLRVE